MIQSTILEAPALSLRNALLKEHYPLVRFIVNSLRSRFPASADFEELHSIGVSGLVAAVERYDPCKADSFKAYACLRIRGSILDELRRMDTLPRTRRAQHRAMVEAVSELEQQLGRAPSDAELANAMGMTPAELEKLRTRVQPSQSVSLDTAIGNGNDDSRLYEVIPDDNQRPGYEKIEHREQVRSLTEKIAKLSLRSQKVLAMYYFENLRLTDIASVFGVTEARICQIHGQALKELRRLMAS